MKTRTHLLLMVLGVIAPLIGLSAYGLAWLLQSEREARLLGIQQVAKSSSLIVDAEVRAAERALQAIAYTEAVRSDDFAELHRQLSSTATPLTWTIIANSNGDGILNTLVPYGTLLAKSTGTWAAEAYNGQRTTVSGLFQGRQSLKGVVSVNVPVPLQVQKKYVFSQIYAPSYFDRVFPAEVKQQGWIAGMFDAKGITIARNTNADRFVGVRVHPAIFNASRQQPTGIVRNISRDGIDVYSIFHRSELTGWTIAIGVPANLIESHARTSMLFAAMACAAVLALALGTAVFFGRLIDRSMRDAAAMARSIGQSGSVTAPRSRLVEVNALLESLGSTHADLQRERDARNALERERETLLASERAARQRLEEQNLAKDNFISMLSHELRNPLASVVAAVAVLRHPKMTTDQQEKPWGIVQRQLGRLTHMLDELLDVRRVLSGKITLRSEVIDVRELLVACMDAKAVSDEANHRWSISTEDKLFVRGDRTRLGQIVDNLLSNAVKFTPPNGSIHIESHSDGGNVVISVKDSGIGMNADLMQKIFEPLVQGANSIDRSQGGLGLGLAIARGLAEIHGGTLTVASDGYDQGSCFYLTLPRHEGR